MIYQVNNRVKVKLNNQEVIVVLLREFAKERWICLVPKEFSTFLMYENYCERYNLDKKYVGQPEKDINEPNFLGLAPKIKCSECLNGKIRKK